MLLGDDQARWDYLCKLKDAEIGRRVYLNDNGEGKRT